jgi:hypothetical protein
MEKQAMKSASARRRNKEFIEIPESLVHLDGK